MPLVVRCVKHFRSNPVLPPGRTFPHHPKAAKNGEPMMADEAQWLRFIPFCASFAATTPPDLSISPSCRSPSSSSFISRTISSVADDSNPRSRRATDMMADDALSPSRRNREEAVTKRPRSCEIGSIGAAAQTSAANEGSMTYQRRGKSEAETKR